MKKKSLSEIKTHNNREIEERFKTLFYNLPEAVVYVDKKCNIIDINPKFTELFGYTLEEIQGKNIDEGFIHPAYLIEEGKRFTKKSFETYINYETIRKRKDGKLIHVSISASPVKVGNKIKGILVIYKDISKRKKMEEDLRHLATHDSLTDLANRNLLKYTFDLESARAKRSNKKLTLVLIDLYNFKYLNDRFGHDVGDIILKGVAKRLKSIFRKADSIFRLGGDEFVILLADIKKNEDLNRIVLRIMDSLKEPIKCEQGEFKVELNIGVAIFPDDGENLESLIKKADIAMYTAKEAGPNSIRYFNEDLMKRWIKDKDSMMKGDIRFRTIFENSPLGTALLDKNGEILNVNQKFLEITGFKRENLINKNISDIFPCSEINLSSINFKKLIEKNETKFECESHFKRNNEDIFLNVYISPSLSPYEEAKFDYLILMVEDITEKKKLTEELKREKDRAQKYLDVSEVIMLVTDLKGNIILINQKGAGILGYNKEDIIGKNWIENFVSKKHREKIRAFYEDIEKRSNKKLISQEYLVLTRSGEERVVLWHNVALSNGKGEIYAILSSGLDITEKRKLEDELKLSLKKFRKFFENAPLGINLTNDRGVILDVNPQWERMFGYGKEEVVGKKTSMELTYPDDLEREKQIPSFQRYTKEAIYDKKFVSYVVEKRFIRKDGSILWAKVTLSPAFDERGKFLFEIAIIEDITYKKEREAERERLLKKLEEEKTFSDTLRDITLRLTSQTDPDELFKEILIQAKRLVPFVSGNVSLVKDNKIVVVASIGYEKYGVEEYISRLVIPIDMYPTDKKVFNTKKPLVIHDTLTCPDWIKYKETEWVRSHILIPMILDGKVIGFLKADSDRPNAFKEENAEKLLPFANVAAIVIRNAQLIKKNHRV